MARPKGGASRRRNAAACPRPPRSGMPYQVVASGGLPADLFSRYSPSRSQLLAAPSRCGRHATHSQSLGAGSCQARFYPQILLRTLAEFTAFFLDICLDQVNFMSRLIRPDLLAGRVMSWAMNEIKADRLPSRSDWVLEKLLARGTLDRGEVAGLLGVSERTSRRVTSALLERKVVVSDSPRSPLRLGFPATVAHHWLPGLFPEAPVDGE